MTYLRLQVFDPPMCCETGVCGPDVDPVLARFARDIADLCVMNLLDQGLCLVEDAHERRHEPELTH